MCLILFSHQEHPGYELVLAANRDEFFQRPTEPAGFWADAPEILGGRDRQAGGTWMGVHRDGRWAAVTNFRDGNRLRTGERSRGELVTYYLRGGDRATACAQNLLPLRHQFGGFNLLLGDRDGVVFLSSELPACQILGPGLYGLSNHLLDSPWPKVERGKRGLREILSASRTPASEGLFDLLGERQTADDDQLPQTGISRDWERTLSAAFISAPGYGTRASSLLLIHQDGAVHFRERSFSEQGSRLSDRHFDFVVSRPDRSFTGS